MQQMQLKTRETNASLFNISKGKKNSAVENSCWNTLYFIYVRVDGITQSILNKIGWRTAAINLKNLKCLPQRMQSKIRLGKIPACLNVRKHFPFLQSYYQWMS